MGTMAKDYSGSEVGEREGLQPLAHLRSEDRDGEEGVRRALELAVLEVTGEIGFRGLTVQRILDSAEVSRPRFYEVFTDKNDCYAAAYDAVAGRLALDLLSVGEREASWREGFRATLTSLATLMAREPLLASGLVAEVHVAGGPAFAKRNEIFTVLGEAVDRARCESPPGRPEPPAIAALFIVNAIEAAVVRALLRGTPEEFAAVIPEMSALADLVYFDER